MKKVLLVVVLLLLLVGCDKTQEKFYLDDEYYEGNEIKEITKKEFQKLEKDKANFGIFVYLPGCTSCATFNEVLTEFIEEKSMTFYKIAIGDAKNTSIDETIEYAPSLILYNEGEVVTFLDSMSDDHIKPLTTVEGFEEWLKEYIYLDK